MRRLPTTVALALLTLLVTAGMVEGAAAESNELASPSQVSIKVQIDGARDRVAIIPAPDGGYHYVVTHLDGRREHLSPAEFTERLHDQETSDSLVQRILNISGPAGLVWVGLGFLGQVLFAGRMIVQWLTSEHHKRSVVPPVFWWMSLAGASLLLIYFIWRRDIVGVLGQSTGWIIYMRNLWLIYRPGQPQLTPDPHPPS
jgi:lipid-A-disaccharide synthase-like uncharacterized protein